MNLPYFISWTKQLGAITFEIESSQDCFYFDKDGRKYFDLSSTSYQAGFGHSDLDIKNAINNQISTLPIASPKSIFPLKERATNKLLDSLGLNMGKIFYTISGAESIENALKMARQYTKKQIILARSNSYHGATLGALSLTGDWRNNAHKTMDEWTIRIPEPKDDPDCIKTREVILKAGPENIAAFCLETITGGNGVVLPPDTWWPQIQKLCKEFKILLILDEVVCGFGRTGKNFGFNHYDLKPDLVCMAKMITGGYIPFGAVWVHPSISTFYNEEILSCGLTNYAHPLGLAAMEIVLDKLKSNDFKEKSAELISTLHLEIKKFTNLKSVKNIRSIGLLCAIDLNVSLSLDTLLENNIYATVSNNRIILAPPFCISNEELTKALSHLHKALEGV